MSEPPDRPRPRPDAGVTGRREQPAGRATPARPRTPARSAAPAKGPVTRIEVQPAQVVAAAGSAIVTAARVGRLLGRTGWRLARQLPGARTRRARGAAAAVGGAERGAPAPATPAGRPGAARPRRRPSPEEQRALDYIRDADPGTAPLRSAMSELLERSVEATRADSRDYLYGTIISQLVPDEARILAALSDGTHFAAIDVVQKLRRGTDPGRARPRQRRRAAGRRWSRRTARRPT